MSIQTNFNPIHGLHSTHTPSVEETVVVLTTTNSDLPEAKRSRGCSYENSETSSPSSAISQSALETFCPVRTIESSASSSSASSSSSQSSSTPTKRTKTVDIKKNGAKLLRRVLILEEFFNDSDHSIFRKQNKVFIGRTKIFKDQQSVYMTIETTKEIVCNFFNGILYKDKPSSEKKFGSIVHYLNDGYYFKISAQNYLKNKFLITIPLPEKLITFPAGTGSYGQFILKPENQKKFLGLVSKFFHFFAEAIHGTSLPPEQNKTFMEGQTRLLVSVVPLSTQQTSEINAPNSFSFGSLVDYAVWKTHNSYDSLDDVADSTTQFMPISFSDRVYDIPACKSIKKIFDAFLKENYYRDTSIEVAKSAPREKRSRPAASRSSGSSTHSVSSQRSEGISTDPSSRVPIGTKGAMTFLISSYLDNPPVELPKIESNKASAEALISLGRDIAEDDEAAALLESLSRKSFENKTS